MSLSRQITAKNLLLDLLRTSESVAWPVKKLIEVAAMFDLQESAVRVNLSRLRTKKLIETDSRGFYQIAQHKDSISAWIDDWALGEARVRHWDGRWLSVSSSKSLKKSRHMALDKALTRLGFKPVNAMTWLRPDNLARSMPELSALIKAFSGASNLLMCSIDSVFVDGEAIDVRPLWNAAEIQSTYQHYTTKLRESQQRLSTSSSAIALPESFALGGEVIKLLAQDPLLPDSMVDQSSRQALTEGMLQYNRLFQKVWMEYLDLSGVDHNLSDQNMPNNSVSHIQSDLVQN